MVKSYLLSNLNTIHTHLPPYLAGNKFKIQNDAGQTKKEKNNDKIRTVHFGFI